MESNNDIKMPTNFDFSKMTPDNMGDMTNNFVNMFSGGANGIPISNDIKPNPTIKSNTLQIECHTAFGPNTPIYVDKRIINMTQLNLAYSQNSTKTLGVNPVTFTMRECGVLAVPEKVYIDYTVDLITEEGIIIECSPGSLVLTEKGYVSVNYLNESEDTIQITKHNIETGEEFVVNSKIDKVDKSRAVISIKTPVYLFISEYGNLFIPFITEREPNIVNLINFKQ